MPTIKELADACGASKPTVKRRLQELGLWDGHVNKQGATFVVDDYAASALSASPSGIPAVLVPDSRRALPFLSIAVFCLASVFCHVHIFHSLSTSSYNPSVHSAFCRNLVLIIAHSPSLLQVNFL